MLGSYSLDLYICLGLCKNLGASMHYIHLMFTKKRRNNNKAANTIPQLNGATYK